MATSTTILDDAGIEIDLDTFTGKMEAMIDAFCAAQKTALIEGKIGFGKTAFFKEYAKKRNRPLYIFNVAQRPQEDLVGHPRVVERIAPDGSIQVITIYTMTEWFYNIVHNEPDAIIVWDEFKNADPEKQAGLLNFLQDRESDGVKLPDTVSMIALCNPTDISANGWNLSAPASNRFCHIEWNFPTLEMIDLMFNNFGYPVDSEQEREFRTNITSYLRQNRNHLHEMPENVDDQGYGWPSPRSWDNAIKVLSNLPDSEAIQEEVLRGYVGRAVAADYHGWLESTRVPDVNEIIVKGEEYPWEDEQATDPATMIRFIYSVLGLVKTDSSNWEAACDFLVKAVEHDFHPQASAIVMDLMKPDNRPEGAKFPVKMVGAFSEIFQRLNVNG